MLDNSFDQAIVSLPQNIKLVLDKLPYKIKVVTKEICLRSQKPVTLTLLDRQVFVMDDGMYSENIRSGVFVVSKEDISNCVRSLTQYSLHSCQDELSQGFITIKGGHRVGVCGSFVKTDKFNNVRDISSLNIRIARQINSVADTLVGALYKNSVKSTLIVGAPSSGKTTLLKDIARSLGTGLTGNYYKVAVIDERGEIAAVHNGISQNDLGVLTDVFDGYPKGVGMNIAMRTMSPNVVILDEIGTSQEAESIRSSLNAGISVIATVHASTVEELKQKKYVTDLINEGGFENIVLLKGLNQPCKINHIITKKEWQELC